LYEQVLKTSRTWAGHDRIMYVVGATQASEFEKIRTIIPQHFLLVPGVGAQGGSLEDVSRYGMNDKCGLLVNASRSIIYAGNGRDFAEKAKTEAQSLQKEMDVYLDKYCR
jgi:orotidine-5'-phosphate decarboxylase